MADGPEPVILGGIALLVSALTAWSMAGDGAFFNANGVLSFFAAAMLTPATLVVLYADRRVFDGKIVMALLYAAAIWQLPPLTVATSQRLTSPPRAPRTSPRASCRFLESR